MHWDALKALIQESKVTGKYGAARAVDRSSEKCMHAYMTFLYMLFYTIWTETAEKLILYSVLSVCIRSRIEGGPPTWQDTLALSATAAIARLLKSFKSQFGISLRSLFRSGHAHMAVEASTDMPQVS